MLSELQRKLEIGSHSERLRAVRELGAMDSREAYQLLEVAVQDVDVQIQDEARRLMRESVWGNGSSARPRVTVVADEQETLFG